MRRGSSRCCHAPLHCILPPYILERLAESADVRVRRLAVEAIAASAAARATRVTLATLAGMAAIPSPAGGKHRLVYDVRQGDFADLPGRLVRIEGQPAVKDRAVNEAYNHSGHTHDFYRRVFDRDSLDDRGMALVSSVHLGRRLNNAFWTGDQMAYGDGDGLLFRGFTRALDVVAHELTHGVVTHTANLEYRHEPGALNEHFADVMGILVRQWRRRQPARQADWRIGVAIMGPGVSARCLRTFTADKAYENDPVLGTDPQPKHLRDKYTGSADSGGVHINSGIPNHAFYLAAVTIGGRAWERAGRIWYRTLLALTPRSGFADAAATSIRIAADEFGKGSREERAVRSAWKDVGL
jgi:Zn-dependent metalloprotease